MNGIYLSDHEPQMLSYLHLYNYLAVDKILVEYSELIIETMQFTHSGEFLEAVENCSLEGFYTGWKHADYVLACAMVPFVAVIRENCLEMMAKGGKIDGEDVWRMMLFDSE